jgi:hypothetical protein
MTTKEDQSDGTSRKATHREATDDAGAERGGAVAELVEAITSMREELKRVAQRVDAVAAGLGLDAGQGGLGFAEEVSEGEGHGRTLFVKTDFGGCWHFWNPDAAEPHLRGERVEENVLRCLIKGLRVYRKPRSNPKYSDSLKLRVELVAGPVSELEAGFDGAFARSLMAAVATAGHSDVGVFQRPVTIEAVLGNEPNVVFANLYVAGERIVPASYAEATTERLFVGALRGLGVADEEVRQRAEAVAAERERVRRGSDS